jgi:hypothetical protein
MPTTLNSYQRRYPGIRPDPALLRELRWGRWWSPPGTPRRLPVREEITTDGPDLTGRVPGMLKRWVRGFRRGWYGVVWAPISDGAGDVRLTLHDHLVPAAALRPRLPPTSAG